MSQSDRAGERETAVVVVKETAAQRSHDPSAFVARPRFRSSPRRRAWQRLVSFVNTDLN